MRPRRGVVEPEEEHGDGDLGDDDGHEDEEEIEIAPAAQPLQQERQPEREQDVQDPLGEDELDDIAHRSQETAVIQEGDVVIETDEPGPAGVKAVGVGQAGVECVKDGAEGEDGEPKQDGDEDGENEAVPVQEPGPSPLSEVGCYHGEGFSCGTQIARFGTDGA